MHQPQPPAAFEITEVIRAEMHRFGGFLLNPLIAHSRTWSMGCLTLNASRDGAVRWGHMPHRKGAGKVDAVP